MVADRAALAITPSARSISGISQPENRFDDGKFMGIPVYLGSVLTMMPAGCWCWAGTACRHRALVLLP
jgi:hypothetical protein